jgi:hypothetical protein
LEFLFGFGEAVGGAAPVDGVANGAGEGGGIQLGWIEGFVGGGVGLADGNDGERGAGLAEVGGGSAIGENGRIEGA